MRLESPSLHATRASATFAALQRAYFDRRRGLYRQRSSMPLRRFESLWPFANTWAATCSLAALRDERLEDCSRNTAELLARRIPAVLRYAARDDRRPSTTTPLALGSTVYRALWSPLSRRFFRVGTAYYDDNEWIALALLQQFDLSGDRRCVMLAQRIFAFAVSGWSKSAHWVHPGGIQWVNARWNEGRNTCSNGPAAEVGAQLFLLTGEQHYLDWSARIYQWAVRVLQRNDGLFADLARPDGHIEARVWSYNQGSMIGAGVLLHQATGERAYLEAATATAARSLEHYADLETLLAEPAAFVAIYFRNLMLLNDASMNVQSWSLAESYATAMWERRREPASGLFGPLSHGINSTAPLVAIEALLAGSAPRP